MNRREQIRIARSCNLNTVIDLTALPETPHEVQRTINLTVDKLSQIPQEIQGTKIDLTGSTSSRVINEVPYLIESDDEPMDCELSCDPIAVVGEENLKLKNDAQVSSQETVILTQEEQREKCQSHDPELLIQSVCAAPVQKITEDTSSDKPLYLSMKIDANSRTLNPIEVKAESKSKVQQSSLATQDLLKENQRPPTPIKAAVKTNDQELNLNTPNSLKEVQRPLTPIKKEIKAKAPTNVQESDSSILNLWEEFQRECLTADSSDQMKVIMSKFTKKFDQATVEYKESPEFRKIIDCARKKIKRFPRLAALNISGVAAGLIRNKRKATKDETAKTELKSKIAEQKLDVNVLNYKDIEMKMFKKPAVQAPETMSTEQREAELARLKAECVRIADECADDVADDVDRLGEVS